MSKWGYICIMGIIPPTMAAILHNSCTIGISVTSMKQLLVQE